RDNIAQKRNKPFYFVFSNEQLLRLAKESNSDLSKVFSSRQKFSKKELKLIQEVISEQFDNSPFVLQTNHVNFSDLPQLQQKLLLWRNQIVKEFDIPKRFVLSKEEILLLDYSTIESVMKKIWFSQQNDKICIQLTNSLLSALNY
ncbi:MAG: HRDC domain-containing protein, partial [Candidatus Hodarchaeales archaeon]